MFLLLKNNVYLTWQKYVKSYSFKSVINIFKRFLLEKEVTFSKRPKTTRKFTSFAKKRDRREILYLKVLDSLTHKSQFKANVNILFKIDKFQVSNLMKF